MRSARALACLAVLAAGALPCAALAQWQWIDSSGRRVFSDKAPPPDVPERNILRQPGGRAPSAAAAPAEAATASPVATASAPRPAGRDALLEQRRKQQETAEADKRKAEEQKFAEQKAENCKRARAAKANVDSGLRMTRVNENGEREILTDAQRAAEAQRLEGIIREDCPAQ
jgi:type IV secretory pathway VirB10-like protein